MDDRIAQLETTTAFLERMLEQLNEVLTTQSKEIELLTKKVDKMQQQLLNAHENVVDKRPPHY